MKYISPILFTLLVLCSCSGETDIQNEPLLYNELYTVMETESNMALGKFTTSLQLKKRLPEDTLKLIASEIKKTNQMYERIFIFYYLKGEKSSGMAWATSHFNPNLEVNILGSTEQEEADAHIEKFGLSYDQRKEIFETAYIDEVAARKKADLKYPMRTAEEAQRDSKIYATYKSQLVQEAQKKLIKKYQITEEVFWEISTEGLELDWTPEGVY